MNENKQPRIRFGGLAWRLGLTGVLLGAGLVSTVRSASGAFEGEAIPVADLTAQNGMISGTVRMAGNRFLLYNGSRLESMGDSMEVKFERGGSMVLCPRSQLQILTADANAGMMLAFQAGGAQEAFPIKMGDQVITPDWRVELTNSTRTGDVGLVQIVTNRHGDLCLQGNAQTGSFFRVTPVMGEGSFQVAGDGQSSRFSDGKMENSPQACGCDAEFSTQAENPAPSSPSGRSMSSPLDRYAASITAPADQKKKVMVADASPAPAMPPSTGEAANGVAPMQPQDSAPPAAPTGKKARQHPEDVAGYVRSFVHFIFGR
ncbi:hypothetical protein [Silvibacterium sp.]|uniref:hypothetical protein n=1 Tax=Silvibacterium sp. TaxID=1964179 RepID=UPI0039E4771F